MNFIAHFEDEIIHGKPLGEPDTGWNSLPDKPICKLEYINPYGDNIVLEGYTEYNHFVEAVQRVGGLPYLTKLFLMGANGDKVKVYKILLDKEFLGQVIEEECARGTEYDGGESWGWKKGIIRGN